MNPPTLLNYIFSFHTINKCTRSAVSKFQTVRVWTGKITLLYIETKTELPTHLLTNMKLRVNLKKKYIQNKKPKKHLN